MIHYIDAYSPVLLARSIVSFKDSLPSSSTLSFSLSRFGSASSRPVKSSRFPPVDLFRLAFFASARLSAMASFILMDAFGIGGSSSSCLPRVGLLGDCVVDLVRVRVGVAVFTVGLEGDVGRRRDAGGISDFCFEGVRVDEGCGMRDITK